MENLKGDLKLTIERIGYDSYNVYKYSFNTLIAHKLTRQPTNELLLMLIFQNET